MHVPYDSPPAGAGFLPTQEQIARVLAPYQTIHERNKLQYLVSHMHKPLWIRTCYATELQPTWESILAAANSLNGGEVEEVTVIKKDIFSSYRYVESSLSLACTEKLCVKCTDMPL